MGGWQNYLIHELSYFNKHTSPLTILKFKNLIIVLTGKVIAIRLMKLLVLYLPAFNKIIGDTIYP
jgi:hypothetical protein